MLPPEDHEALADLLVDLFGDSESLRQFVTTTSGAQLVAVELPGTASSVATLAHDVAQRFASHGLLTILFERLQTKRPQRSGAIISVAQRLGVTLRPTTPTDLAGERSPSEMPAALKATSSARLVKPELLQRFTLEPGGRRRLVAALQEQAVAGHDPIIATRLAEAAQLQHFPMGASLVEQDGADTDILLLLVGNAAVVVNGREVAVRRAGQHVGEMAMIDPSQRRSATIAAHAETIVARISEDDFVRVAEEHPILWRRLAVELGVRLRERGRLVRPRNPRPVVFIGSTIAGLPVARELEMALTGDAWDIRVWSDGPHGIGKSSPESLMAQLSHLDFGVLLLTQADLPALAGDDHRAREALVFQAGILLGTLGRDGALVARVRGLGEEWPRSADLGGVRCLDIDSDSADRVPRLLPLASEIRTLIQHNTHE